jgi:hypothetical protein
MRIQLVRLYDSPPYVGRHLRTRHRPRRVAMPGETTVVVRVCAQLEQRVVGELLDHLRVLLHPQTGQVSAICFLSRGHARGVRGAREFGEFYLSNSVHPFPRSPLNLSPNRFGDQAGVPHGAAGGAAGGAQVVWRVVWRVVRRAGPGTARGDLAEQVSAHPFRSQPTAKHPHMQHKSPG